MSKRRTAVAAVAAVAAAVAVGGAIGLGVGREPGTDPSPTSSAGSPSAAAPNAPQGSSPGRTESRAGTNEPGASASPSSHPSSQPSASPGGSGVEVLPEVPGSTPSTLPGLGTSSTVPLPDWDDLADKSVSARGRLVTGYPSRLLPVAPRATIVTSSVAPASDRVQVGLVARGDQSAQAVVRFYRARLARAGFEEESVPAVGGADATAFTRDGNRVVVTVDPGRTGTYSVYAVLVIGKA